ncbi:hypothetical protein AKJ42_03670, partial [candidate division MSBL1 archaeon SCGC-AAA261C02]
EEEHHVGDHQIKIRRGGRKKKLDRVEIKQGIFGKRTVTKADVDRINAEVEKGTFPKKLGILVKFAIKGLGEETNETLKWIEENPRYLKLLKILQNNAMSITQIARELGVKYATANGYAGSCAERGAIRRKKRGRGYRAEITESGRKILNLLDHSSRQ